MSHARMQTRSSSFSSAHIMQKLWLACLLCLLVAGCSSSKATDSGSEKNAENNTGRVQNESAFDTRGMAVQMEPPLGMLPPPPVEVSNEPNAHLLAARLSPEQLEQGWVRLYDGSEMMGWFYIGAGNWSFADGTILVDGGEPSLLCTSFQASDYELLIDFKCSAKTDSGILLRSSADPRDMSRDCYELSIAPADSDYPTGSLVKRQKVDSNVVGEVTADQWHTYRVIVQGDEVKVWLDGTAILEYTDNRKLRRGYIALQHNIGVVRFRNILMRPLGSHDLALDENWQNDWKSLENAGPTFKVDTGNAGLRLHGGPGQIESNEQWDDFILQATYQVANPNVDSGILFRGLADRYNEAYECQIYHGPTSMESGKKSPVKLQTGALNIPSKGEATNARILAGTGTSPTYVTIISDEGQFSTFINGLLVADVADTREASVNPRTGFRRAAGKVALQAQDENCDITFSRLNISAIAK